MMMVMMAMKKTRIASTCRESGVRIDQEAMEVAGGEAEEEATSYDAGAGGLPIMRRSGKIVLFVAVFVVVPSIVFLYSMNSTASFSSRFPPIPSTAQRKEGYKLEKILENAAMRDDKGTVIVTTVNEAWAANNSLLDLFLESFRIGNNTQRLLNHLVIITLDQQAYERCISLHPHCYALQTNGVLHRKLSQEALFLTQDYLNIVWRNIYFSYSLLKMGYNIIVTDVDIMWLRDPFEHFFENADVQIACDHYVGRSNDMNNFPNGGFTYVRSNSRSISFYKLWYTSRIKYPGNRNQDVFNKIKYDPYIKKMGLKMRFLDTAYFGGFCEHSKDLNLVATMHANCCIGLQNKVQTLRMVLDDWRNFKSSTTTTPSWTFPQNCGDRVSNHQLHSPP